jgi:hypothetical protein
MLLTEICNETGTENAIGTIGIWIFDLGHTISSFSLCHSIDVFQKG